ncbi:MAG: OmpA family protein [Steroidobacteraceae bacterium]|nr:OmpA family protein [Deltaproteobacteria bacterium]
MKTLQYFTLVALAASFAGCATVAPTELVNARSAYQLASDGPAQQLEPAELHKAHEALILAENSFRKEPDSYRTKDLAYVAQRKSEQAGALGSIAAAKASKDGANADFQTKQSEIVEQGKKNLSDSEKRTTDAQAENARQAALKSAKDKADADSQMQQAAIAQGKMDLNAAEKRTAETQAELDKQAALKLAKEKADADSQLQQAEIAQGKKDLNDAEKRTADALADLASLASLKEEERGLVLTLSGSVLFRSAEATLLPQAQVKLDQVAKALLAIRARNLIIEGHTDSQGTEAYNQSLSQRRSDAVRDYLVQGGYPADHIQSRGKGEVSPIAKNTSTEGRANNRRVEIVIEREAQLSKK